MAQAGAAYAEALHKAFPEAERDWALLGLARLRRLQGDQEAARALLEASDWVPSRIARRSIEIASEICIYTDNVISVEAIGE